MLRHKNTSILRMSLAVLTQCRNVADVLEQHICMCYSLINMPLNVD